MSSYRLRKVLPDWKHPKDDEGGYISLRNGNYTGYFKKKLQEIKEMWNKGFQEDYDIIDEKLIDNT